MSAELRRLASAATPGPWTLRCDTPWGSKVIFNDAGEMYVGVSAYTAAPLDGWSPDARQRANELGRSKCADAAFIAAANPAAVLALLDRVDSLEAAIRAHRDEFHPDCDGEGCIGVGAGDHRLWAALGDGEATTGSDDG